MTPLATESKLPATGVTIFTRMSQLAAEVGALNLSQGFPDFDAPEPLLERVQHHLRSGANQYAPMMGVPALRVAVARKVADLYGRRTDPDTEVTITSGATEALYGAIAATVRPGDEVIIFEPAYDSYEPAVVLHGGVVRRVALVAPEYRVDWDRVRSLMSDRTRLIITNTPHNPTGAVWTQTDIEALQSIVRGSHSYVLADEVYEHILFDGQRHESLCRYPELFERSFIVSSFGKTYHVTGWKIGYCVAPAALTVEFRKIHQYVTFTSNTPVQLGLADFLEAHPEHHQRLSNFYQRKRDRLLAGLSGSRFRWLPTAGTYFQCLEYSAISDEPDTRWTEWLARERGIALIPVSVFSKEPAGPAQVRVCFANDDDTLDRAAELLCAL
ncbi:MAG: methionine aminotransferase [Pseudomonadota bacterium]